MSALGESVLVGMLPKPADVAWGWAEIWASAERSGEAWGLLAILKLDACTEAPSVFVIKAAVDTDIAWEPVETCESVKLSEEIWESLKVLEDAIPLEGLFF